jgi:peptide subunit release factor RF-3
VKLKLVPLSFSAARWVQGEFDLSPFRYTETIRVVQDRERRPVLLFASAWTLESTIQRHPDLELSGTADPRQLTSAG